MNIKTPVHFTSPYLINPTNPILLNIIGAGGNGSNMLTAVARMNHALTTLGHPGFQVNLFDDDLIAEANLGRQLFADAELGLPKSVALINRTNRFFGTNWKAITEKFNEKIYHSHQASIYISCVDTAPARFDIARCLKLPAKGFNSYRDSGKYWMDIGNGNHTGQVVLSTIVDIPQPQSNQFLPVGRLPFITDAYQQYLNAVNDTDVPSCSLAEALIKQDLYINSTLAQMAASLLWNLFRNGLTLYKGFFLDLHSFRSNPVAVDYDESLISPAHAA
jgi:PRTRC genetic system ThiF family protein